MSKFSIHPSWLAKPTNFPLAASISDGSIIKESAAAFNDEQVMAISQLTGRSCINAGAGTGKSTCLIARMQRIVQEYPDAHVLMISFTRKSARELRERIGSPQHVQVSTFHSLAFHILRSNGFADFRIDLNDASQSALIQKLIGKNDTTPEEVIHSLRCPNAAATPTMAVRQKYLKTLLDNKILTFDTMQIFAHMILQKCQNVLHRWQNCYDFILVDEYQDVDTLQAELLEMLCQSKQNLCVVGDSRQSIYSFRGAIPDAMKHFSRDALYDLTVNYRCNPAILGLANQIMPTEKPLVSAHSAVAPVYPEYLTATDEVDEARQIAAAIQKIHKSGMKYRDIVVLYRSSSAASAVLEELLSRKVPSISTSQIYMMYNAMPLAGLIKLLRAAMQPNDMNTFKAILPILYIKRNLFKTIANIAVKKELSLFDAAMSLNLPFFHQEYIASLSTALAKAKDLSPIDAANLLLKQGYGKYIGRDMLPEAESYIAKLSDYSTIPAYLAHVAEISERYEAMRKLAASNADYVQLMSIHASKGMEFNTVFLIGCYDGSLPSNRDDADPEEERRLLYVAITRAREHLFISYPQSTGKSIEPNQASRFLRKAFSMP